MSRSYTRKVKRHDARLRLMRARRQRTLARRAKIRTKISSRTEVSW